MSEEVRQKIPARLESAVKGGYVTGAKDIVDDALGKAQSVINEEVTEDVSDLKDAVGTGGSVDERINTEKTRAQGVEQGLNTRLSVVEQLAEISVEGSEIGIATAADFESDDSSDLAKVPTVSAILGGANDGVYDISARHNGTKYADLAAALGTNGANVPVGIRKGGMSVKFVQMSDNKYVQYRLTKDAWSTNVVDWVDAPELNNMPGIDLAISDEYDKTLARFYGGEFEVKNFNTKTTPKIGNEDNTVFSLSDENNNDILQIKDGHLRTKKFRSYETPFQQEGKKVFSVCDEQDNEIVQIEDGEIRTRNFYSALLPNFKNYINRRISILGDSISTFGTPDSRNQDGTYCYSYYPSQTCRYSEAGNVTEDGVTYDSIKFNVHDTWWMILLSKLKANLGINDSWRGSSISNVRGADSALSNQTRINHLGENGEPDLILVYGGTNDAGAAVAIGTFDTTPPPTAASDIAALGNSTFAEGVRTLLVRLMYTYPNSEIVVILPTLTVSYYTIQSLDLYIEIMKEACDYYGIKYIDIRIAGINFYNKSRYFIDGIHPNKQGMRLISETIYNSLKF